MSRTYNITVPSLFATLSSLYIGNPSNVSFLIGQYSPSFPNSIVDCEKLYVTLPENVTYSPSFLGPPNANKVTGLTVSFGNSTNESDFSANLTYWQKVDSIENVEINYQNLTDTDLGNGTWMETHTIIVKNNSNDPLWLPTLDYDRFMMQYVIRNSTRVYWNGNLHPEDELLGDATTTLYIGAFLSPQTTFNITVTYLTTQQPI